MDFQKLAEMGMQLSKANAMTERASQSVSSHVSRSRSSVLDDFVGTRSGSVRMPDGSVRTRVIDKSATTGAKKKVTDSYTAEQLLGMPRNERRRYLGSLSAKSRSKMLGEMNKIKDSRKVTDAIEGIDGDVEKSQLINLVVLLNNIRKDDSEFTRKLLSECLETLPDKYAEYTYSILDNAPTNLSEEEILDIETELDDIRRTFNIEDSRERVTDSVLDDVVEQPVGTSEIDSLLEGIGEYLKTGSIDKLSSVRQMMMGGGAKESEEETEEESSEESQIEENTNDIFGEDSGESEETEGTEELDLFGDETEDTEDTEESEDTGDEEKDDVGFEDTGDVIEVPEGVDESVKDLVQELLDIFGSKGEEGIGDSKLQKICVNTKKFVKDSLESEEGDIEGSLVLTADEDGYELSEYPTFEASEELLRVPLTYQDYASLSNASIRESDIKSLMPRYSCCTSQIEPCNSRCVKVTSEDGMVSYWTPICGSVDTECISTMTCDDLQKSYVPVSAFCQYAVRLNQLDLIDNNFYKEVVESPMWKVLEDCEVYGLSAGDSIIPDSEGEIKIFDRCYKKVSNE